MFSAGIFKSVFQIAGEKIEFAGPCLSGNSPAFSWVFAE